MLLAEMVVLPTERMSTRVTRRGQTTISLEIRKQLGIEEGQRLMVEAVEGKVVYTKVPSLFDLAGTSEMKRAEAIRLLDKMREEE